MSKNREFDCGVLGYYSGMLPQASEKLFQAVLQYSAELMDAAGMPEHEGEMDEVYAVADGVLRRLGQRLHTGDWPPVKYDYDKPIPNPFA